MQALGSSRFFALRVVGEGGMKATLGIGFEERADAFDFNTTLQDVRKLLGSFNIDANTGGRTNKDIEQAGKSEKKGKLIDSSSSLGLGRENNIDSNSRIKVDLSASERMRARNSSTKSISERLDNSESSAERVNKRSSVTEAVSIPNQTMSSVGIPFLPPPPPPSSTSSASGRTNRRHVKANDGKSTSMNEAASKGKADNTFDDVDAISSTNREYIGDDDDFGDFC